MRTLVKPTRGIALAVACVAAFAARAARADEPWGGVLAEGAASPPRASDGAATGGTWLERARFVRVDTAAELWDPAEHAAQAFSTDARGDVAPLGVGLQMPLATQAVGGVDVGLSLRYRTFTSEGVGRAVDARLSIARSLGPLRLAANALLGDSMDGRDDVDFAAGARVAMQVAPVLQLGVEARLRTEAVDTTHTEDDDGRPIEWVGGAGAAVDLGAARVQSLVGWCSPRGWIAPGPVSVVSAALAF